MDMAQDGASKKVSSLLENKGAANEDLIETRKEAEETNFMVHKRGRLVSQELREGYMSQKRTTVSSKVTAKIKKVTSKVVSKIVGKVRLRKKRTMRHPIVGAALKFHKDDDVYLADVGLPHMHNKEM